MSVRTRFAPSPTGFLHIGGVRTALFNWLLARHHGGQFVLRIDDTDQQRHVERAVGLILEGFRWMGMDWDEGPEVDGPHGPYFQSQRGHLYQEATEKLIASGHAYRDYSTEAERAADRAAAEAEKRPYRFRRKPLTDEQVAAYEKEGRPYALRFEVPQGRTIAVDDLIKGPRRGQRRRRRRLRDRPARRLAALQLRQRRRRRRDADLPRRPRRGAPVEHLPAGPDLRGARLRPPGVRPRPLRRGSGVEEEALEAGRGGRPPRVHQRRVLARGDDELPGPARLELRRLDRALLAGRADREVHARPRQQLAGQPRPGQALLDRGGVDEGRDARPQGRADGPLRPPRRRVGRLGPPPQGPIGGPRGRRRPGQAAVPRRAGAGPGRRPGRGSRRSSTRSATG